MVNYEAFEFRRLIVAFNMVEVEEKVAHGFLVRSLLSPKTSFLFYFIFSLPLKPLHLLSEGLPPPLCYFFRAPSSLPPSSAMPPPPSVTGLPFFLSFWP